MFEITWMQLAWLFEILFIMAVFFAMKRVILERIYGVRFKNWVEIDTGRHGYVILDKTLDSGKIMGSKRTVAQENIVKGIIYYVRDCVENLKLESAGTDWKYYCNTEEFDTVSKNQLLKQLLYILEKNYIIAILIVVFISLVVSAYNVYQVHQQQQYIEFLVQKIGEINGAAAGQTGTVINPG